MLQKLKILLPSYKARKALLSILFISATTAIINLSAIGASLNSLDISGHSLVLNAEGVNKINIEGNNTEDVIIILPNVILKDIYSINSVNLTTQLKNNIPEIKSLQVFQHSIEPPEARITIKATNPIEPKVKKNEKTNEIVIELKCNNTAQSRSFFTEKQPDYKNFQDTPSSPTKSIPPGTDLFKILSLRRTGEIALSKSEIEKFLIDNPDDLWANYYLSLIHLDTKDFEKAKELNNKILKLNPDFFTSYFTLGIINDIEGNSDQAIELYKKANKLYPEYLNGHYRLGLAYLKKGEFELAEDEFKWTISIYPEHTGALQNLGLIYLKTSRLELAKTYFKQSLRTDVLNNFGNLLLETDKGNEALNYFLLALNLDPENSILNYNVAKAYQASEEYEKALNYYQKALTIDPEMFNAFYNIAVIKTQQGKSKEAIEAFTSYLHLNPQADDASQVTSLISKLEEISQNEHP